MVEGTVTGPARLGMRSLLGGLMLRVSLGLAIALAAVGWLFWSTLEDVGNLAQDEMLRRQVNDLLPALRRSRQGQITLDLPEDLKDVYLQSKDGAMFVLHDGNGRVYKASLPNAPLLLQKGLFAATTPMFVNTEADDGANARYMLVRPLWLKPTPVYLTVAQLRTIDDVMLQQAGRQALTSLLLWLIPCLIIGLGLVGSTLSRGLVPLRELSEAVKALGARRLDQRLSAKDLPSEIKPLADSVNQLREQLARALESQRQLTADMAHQLKTPLAIMQARLELMDNLPGRDDLLQDSRRLGRLIQQMLHFSQLLESDTEMGLVDLRQVAEDVVARLVPLADQNGVDLRFRAPDTPVTVRGEALLLAEAVQNLVDNAIQHTAPKTGVDVQVGDDGVIEVLDRGPGVPPMEKTLIFSRFWRAESMVGGREGSGLGLAIVAEIVRRHGGTVAVDDRDLQTGGGAIFRISLPRAAAPKTPQPRRRPVHV